MRKFFISCLFGFHNYEYKCSDLYNIIDKKKNEKITGEVRLTLFVCSKCSKDKLVVSDRKDYK